MVSSLRYVPLTCSGLQFDPEKLVELGCAPSLDDDAEYLNSPPQSSAGPVPDIHIDAASPSSEPAVEEKNMDAPDWSHFSQSNGNSHANGNGKSHRHHLHPFHDMMHKAHVSLVHDSLEFSSGLGFMPVLSWKIVSLFLDQAFPLSTPLLLSWQLRDWMLLMISL